MNRKYMLPLFAIILIGSVFAVGYVVNNFVLTTDIYEPFSVEYAIIGDASNWDGTTTCDTYAGDWQIGTDVDVGGLYAGEGRVICTKITNAGEGDVDYTFSGEVVSGLGNLEDCQNAFGNPSVSGTVSGLSTITDGAIVMVADNAVPVEDCQITLSVSRG